MLDNPYEEDVGQWDNPPVTDAMLGLFCGRDDENEMNTPSTNELDPNLPVTEAFHKNLPLTDESTDQANPFTREEKAEKTNPLCFTGEGGKLWDAMPFSSSSLASTYSSPLTTFYSSSLASFSSSSLPCPGTCLESPLLFSPLGLFGCPSSTIPPMEPLPPPMTQMDTTSLSSTSSAGVFSDGPWISKVPESSPGVPLDPMLLLSSCSPEKNRAADNLCTLIDDDDLTNSGGKLDDSDWDHLAKNYNAKSKHTDDILMDIFRRHMMQESPLFLGLDYLIRKNAKPFSMVKLLESYGLVRLLPHYAPVFDLSNKLDDVDVEGNTKRMCECFYYPHEAYQMAMHAEDGGHEIPANCCAAIAYLKVLRSLLANSLSGEGFEIQQANIIRMASEYMGSLFLANTKKKMVYDFLNARNTAGLLSFGLQAGAVPDLPLAKPDSEAYIRHVEHYYIEMCKQTSSLCGFLCRKDSVYYASPRWRIFMPKVADVWTMINKSVKVASCTIDKNEKHHRLLGPYRKKGLSITKTPQTVLQINDNENMPYILAAYQVLLDFALDRCMEKVLCFQSDMLTLQHLVDAALVSETSTSKTVVDLCEEESTLKNLKRKAEEMKKDFEKMKIDSPIKRVKKQVDPLDFWEKGGGSPLLKVAYELSKFSDKRIFSMTSHLSEFKTSIDDVVKEEMFSLASLQSAIPPDRHFIPNYGTLGQKHVSFHLGVAKEGSGLVFNLPDILLHSLKVKEASSDTGERIVKTRDMVDGRRHTSEYAMRWQQWSLVAKFTAAVVEEIRAIARHDTLDALFDAAHLKLMKSNKIYKTDFDAMYKALAEALQMKILGRGKTELKGNLQMQFGVFLSEAVQLLAEEAKKAVFEEMKTGKLRGEKSRAAFLFHDFNFAYQRAMHSRMKKREGLIGTKVFLTHDQVIKECSDMSRDMKEIKETKDIEMRRFATDHAMASVLPKTEKEENEDEDKPAVQGKDSSDDEEPPEVEMEFLTKAATDVVTMICKGILNIPYRGVNNGFYVNSRRECQMQPMISDLLISNGKITPASFIASELDAFFSLSFINHSEVMGRATFSEMKTRSARQRGDIPDGELLCYEEEDSMTAMEFVEDTLDEEAQQKEKRRKNALDKKKKEYEAAHERWHPDMSTRDTQWLMYSGKLKTTEEIEKEEAVKKEAAAKKV